LSFRHRVCLEEPKAAHARVRGLRIVGAFIPEAGVRLSDGLNALIGSKGSGKTALVECLRFVLNTPVPPERRESVDRHISHVLGPSGYVECLVQLVDGRRLLISRRADARDRITVVDDSASRRAYYWPGVGEGSLKRPRQRLGGPLDGRMTS
jgi:hypothetical protein